jgi:hypothetical protein
MDPPAPPLTWEETGTVAELLELATEDNPGSPVGPIGPVGSIIPVDSDEELSGSFATGELFSEHPPRKADINNRDAERIKKENEKRIDVIGFDSDIKPP